LSHIITDGIAIITYHTPEAQKEDKFWVIWHIIIYILSVLSIIIFAIPFWLAMIFANIMDLWDWFILRPIQKKKRRKNPEYSWGNNLYFHTIVDWFRDKFLFWLPKWNYKKSGVLLEIIIIILSSTIIFFII
jgi:energy-coupling factor transporter transmembrane protein EcfT